MKNERRHHAVGVIIYKEVEQFCTAQCFEEDQYSCDNGECIHKSGECNGVPRDCLDGSDEKNCNYPGCDEGEFDCGDRKCIPQDWVNDCYQDCHDGSDEAGIDKETGLSCD